MSCGTRTPPSGYAPATDTSIYDALGQRIAVQQTEQLPGGTVSSTTRVFSYDGDGQILSRTDGTVSGTGTSATFTALSGATTANPDALAPQHYVYAEGHSIAGLSEAGTIQTRDGLTPYSDPQGSGSYTVQAGDTLQSIAQTVYGNASLWYVIADANAISLDSSGNAINLVAGTTLKLPAVSNQQNSSQTFTPYNPLKLIGSTTPALAYIPPPPSQHCNDLTTLIVVAVTVVAAVYTAGAAAEALGAEGVAGSTATGVGAIGAAATTGGTLTAGVGETMALGSLGTDLVAAGVGGFAGSVAGQLTGQALGDGAGFSLREALAGGLTGLASAGLGDLAGGNNLYQSIARGDIGNAVLQGGATDLAGMAANRVVGLPGAFSWASVAAASLAAGLSADLAPTVLGDLSLTANTVPGDLAQGLTSGVIGRNVDLAFGQAAPGYGTLAADAFGNAIGNDLSGVDAYRQGQVQYQQQQQQAAIAALSPSERATFNLLNGKLPTATALADAQKLQAVTDTPLDARHPSLPDLQQAPGTYSSLQTAAWWNVFGQDTTQATGSASYLSAEADANGVAGLVPIAQRISVLRDMLPTLKQQNDPNYAALAQLAQVATYALIDKDVYYNNAVPQILPDGITRIGANDTAALKQLNLTPDMLVDPKSGFYSAVYYDANANNYIVADRGTQNGIDWINNFQQLFGLDSKQYDEAAKVARSIQKMNAENVVFTGHSLGGGLAALQALVSGLPAYTFNAAGLNAETVSREGASFAQADTLIHAYTVDHELLTTLQDYSPAPSADGARTELTPVSFSNTAPNSEAPIPAYQDYNPGEMFALHSIVEVAHALNYQLTQLYGTPGG